jgi:hypothetical protein
MRTALYLFLGSTLLMLVGTACVSTTTPGLPPLPAPRDPAAPPLAREWRLVVDSHVYSTDGSDVRETQQLLADAEAHRQREEARAHSTTPRTESYQLGGFRFERKLEAPQPSGAGATDAAIAGFALGRGLMRPAFERTFRAAASAIVERSGVVSDEAPEGSLLLLTMRWKPINEAKMRLTSGLSVLTLGLAPVVSDEAVEVEAMVVDGRHAPVTASRSVIVTLWAGLLGPLALAAAGSGPPSTVGNLDRWLLPLGLAAVDELRDRAAAQADPADAPLAARGD